MKYAFMKAHEGIYRQEILCRALGVSRSGFTDWRSRGGRYKRKQAQAGIDAKVAEAFHASQSRSGAPRLTLELGKKGLNLDKKTVANSLKRQSLRAKAARKFRATTQSAHNRPVAPNLLERDFAAKRRNEKYVGDITYLWTDAGWLYLAVFIDLYSRAVVGWSISPRMTSDLVCDAFSMAMMRRGNPTNVIVHSDRGIQYCSQKFQDLLRKHRCKSSMSRKGNCWDNAVAESFFRSLKIEAFYGERFETRESLKQSMFEYIEVYYNRVRLHSANGYISPAAFEARKVA